MSQTKCQLFDVSVEGPTALKNGANDATLDGSGNLSISAGNLVLASGSGIDFSANANAAGTTSELLDDYEEGTWTVTLRGGSISSPTHTATPIESGAHNAKYVKIGNKVFFHFYERWNISTWTGSWTGINFELPFTPDNFASITISYWSSFFNTSLSSTYQPAGYIDPNGLCRLTLQAITQSGESDNNNGTISLSSSAGLMISGIYTTA
jgi:hypothetical protein